MENIKKEPKPIDSLGLLSFPFKNLYILGALQAVNCPCTLSSYMDLGQVEGIEDRDIPAHKGFRGRRLTLSCGYVPSELKIIYLRDNSRTGSV